MVLSQSSSTTKKAVFQLKVDANLYQSIYPLEKNNWDIWDRFNGNPIDIYWPLMTMEVTNNENEIESKIISDFPSLATHVPVFSERAINALKDILDKNGELFPLDFPDHSQNHYFAYNVTCVANVIDVSASEIRYFKSGRIMDIVKHQFISDKIDNLEIFKIPELLLMDVFVTNNFVERVKQHELTGFYFKKVWSSFT